LDPCSAFVDADCGRRNNRSSMVSWCAEIPSAIADIPTPNRRASRSAMVDVSCLDRAGDALVSNISQCEAAIDSMLVLDGEAADKGGDCPDAAFGHRSAILPMNSVLEASCQRPVLLHIYDVSTGSKIQKLNKLLAHRRSPVKFGGVFHAGIEVDGYEWCFGFSDNPQYPGVSYTAPKENPDHHFRQTIPLEHTELSVEEVNAVLLELMYEYPGPDYDLLRRNCCHFADDLCQRLGAGRIPGWVHRLARMGAQIDNVLGVSRSLSVLPTVATPLLSN